jgi:hypothetical protein
MCGDQDMGLVHAPGSPKHPLIPNQKKQDPIKF